MRICLLFLVLNMSLCALGQTLRLDIRVTTEENQEALEGVGVELFGQGSKRYSDANGKVRIEGLIPGTYTLIATYPGFDSLRQNIKFKNKDLSLVLRLQAKNYKLEEVAIEEQNNNTFGITRLNDIEGTAIYAAKKNEVVVINDLTANLATNNSRQIYAKVPGLNIWESDGAGVQLGIGGRGLSPNRNANFNTRQNGYDISADALGYPESYYTPPVEAIERIEIIRGAASLQYGTQFGGMLNFTFKEGPIDKKIELTTRQTVGSFGLYSSFNSVGGSTDKVRYYAFYQYKRSNGWRPNSNLEQHTAYASVRYQVNSKLSIRPEYSFTTYLAQQPGGLTDTQFAQNPLQSNRERNWFQVNWNLFSLNIDYDLQTSTRLNTRTFGLVAGRDALGNLNRITEIDFGQNRDFLSDTYRNWGNETRLIHRYSFRENPSTFLVGMRYYDGFTIKKQGEGNKGNGPDFYFLNPERLEGSDFDLPSTNFAAFVENVLNIHPKFSITPGLRFEYIRTESEGYYREISQDLAGNILLDNIIEEERSSSRAFVFGGLGLSFKPNGSFELYTNFSQNYRAINFNDIRVNVGSLVVDSLLQDEQGYNFDLGIRGEHQDWLSFDLSMFYLAYKDRIGTVLRTEPNPQFNNLVDRTFRFRTNVADAEIFGIEAYGEVELLQFLGRNNTDLSIAIFGNFAAIEAKYINATQSNIDGKDVELVPPINLKGGISGGWKNLKGTFQYSFIQEHFSDATNAIQTPTAIEGLIPSYEVMDLSFSYSLKRFKFETGINNLSNNFYFTRRATGYPGPGIIPSDGRNFYGTLEFRW